ncbi:hypothetical protein Hanom_Chr00s159635g01824761 [Helianthus anomalus]
MCIHHPANVFFYFSICAFLALSGKIVLLRLEPRRAFYNPVYILLLRRECCSFNNGEYVKA